VAGGPEELWERVSERIGGLDEEDLKRDLVELAEGSGGAILVREPGAGPASWSPEGPAAARALSARSFGAAVDRQYRLTSFTALVGGARGVHSPEQLEGLDRDELAASGPQPIAEAGAASPDLSNAPGDLGPRLPLGDFPRGAKAGNLLHHLLETLDFAACPEAMRDQVRQAHARFGLDPEGWDGVLSESLRHWLDCPLPVEEGEPVRLGALPREARRAELEFVLPVAEGGDRTRTLLTPARLGAVFAAFGAERPLLAAYARRLSQVSRLPLHGFLRGFVDLVFRHGGRYHLVDWKSNHLGSQAEDYAPVRLEAVMLSEHYVLQYHLYLVALHRHLRARLPTYDYDEHMGSAYYLFLRGMAQGGPAEAGIFRDRPPRALIEALSEVLDGGAALAPSRGGSNG
jgi:exodeoxyribonuclease V beta subunit